jgi:hypothetical protein
VRKFNTRIYGDEKPITNVRTFYEVLKRKAREFWINEEIIAS